MSNVTRQLNGRYGLHFLSRYHVEQFRTALNAQLPEDLVEEIGNISTWEIEADEELLEAALLHWDAFNPDASDEVKAEWLYTGIKRYKYLTLYLMLQQLPLLGLVNLTSEWSQVASSQIAKKSQNASQRLKRVLIETEASQLLVNSFTDSFENNIFVDSNLTTMKVDTEKGVATSFSDLKSYTLLESDFTIKIDSQHFAGYSSLSSSAPRDSSNDARKVLLQQRYYVTKPGSSIDLYITFHPTVENFKDTSYLIVDMPIQNGIEEIAVGYVADGKTYRHSFDITSSKLFVQLQNKNNSLTELHMIVTSNKEDGFDSRGFYHNIVLGKIQLMTGTFAFENNVLATKDIEFADTNGEIVKIQNLFVDVPHPHVNIFGSWHYADTDTWVRDVSIPNKTAFALGVNKRFSNASRAEQVTKPAPLFFPMNQLLTLGFYLANTSLVDWIDSSIDPTYVLDPRQCVVIRNTGSISPYTDTTYPELSDIPDSGWSFDGSQYSTTVVVQKGQEYTFNFGSVVVYINGEEKSGNVTFLPGAYTILISQKYWTSIPISTNDSNIKSVDPWYPHNPRYLIQGLPQVGAYSGVSEWGETVCKYVDPDIMMSGLFKERKDIFSCWTVEESGQLNTYFIFPMKAGYSHFNKERIRIWGTQQAKAGDVDKFNLLFKFQDLEAVLLPEYTVRGA